MYNLLENQKENLYTLILSALEDVCTIKLNLIEPYLNSIFTSPGLQPHKDFDQEILRSN